MIYLKLLDGRLYVDGERRAPAPRELELLYTLALAPHPIPGRRLATALWPDAPDGGGNALCQSLHRLRRVAGAKVLRRLPEGWWLGRDVVTDLGEMLALERSVRSCGRLERDLLERLQDAYAALATATPPPLQHAPGTAATFERRVTALTQAFGERLASHAVRSGDAVLALSVAQRMLDVDRCDESAWEIAIRVHLQRGDRVLAWRDFRRYAQALDDELGLTPSAHLRGLLDDTLTGRRAS